MIDSLIRDAYTLHVHCSPDGGRRAQAVYDLASAAQAAGMAGIDVTDRTTSTIGRCHALNLAIPEAPRFFNSIVLNLSDEAFVQQVKRLQALGFDDRAHENHAFVEPTSAC